MAAIGAVGDVYEMTTICRYGGQNGLNKTHWKVTFIIGSPEEPSTASGMNAMFQTQYTDYLSDQCKYVGLTWQKIHPLPVADLNPVLANATGSRESQVGLPTQVSGILTKRTGVAGRANRGRIYLPFWQESDNSSASRPEAAAITLMAGIAGTFETTHVLAVTGGSITLQPVIWRRGPRTTIAVTSVSPRLYWATQRRRSFVREHDDALIPAAL